MNPVASRDEQLAFANNLRSVADRDIAKIKQDTYNLGTHVPSNLGGLTGSTGLWKRNFVSPKVESMTQGIKAVAQSSALENAMNNYLNQTKQKYNNAYKAYAKRAGSGRGGYGGGGGGGYYTGGGNNADVIKAYLDWLAQQGLDTEEVAAGDANVNANTYNGESPIGSNSGGMAWGAGIGGTLGAIGGIPGIVAGAALGGKIGSYLPEGKVYGQVGGDK